jgi:3-dehydroquinate synthase
MSSIKKIALADYSIFVGSAWEEVKNLLQRPYSKIAVLTDENTHRLCLPLLQQQFDTSTWQILKIPAGEQHKNLSTCSEIWKAMLAGNLNRNALLINLGGGVIGDMGGFCAGTYKRGIDFIQMPTTLLSQVDASIGGKLGIDFEYVKNCVGLFQNPQAVFIFPEFLETLDQREVRSGFAEMIKHSLIADARQWEKLSSLIALDVSQLTSMLPASLQIKKKIVEEDPFEKGIRKALNFGHTIGHAIESWLLPSKTPLLHGEAIAIGMICENYLSHQMLDLPQADMEKITQFILTIYGKTAIPTSSYDQLIQLMRKDKKNEAMEINCTLLHQIGEAAINQDIPEAAIRKSLDYYNSL